MTLDKLEGGARRPRRWPWILGAGVVVVAMLVVAATFGGWFGGGSPEARPSTPTATAPSVVPSAELPTPTPGATETVPAPTPTEVPLDQPVDPVPGVTVSIASLEAVEGEPRGPGEVAGPALRVGVAIQNSTGEALDLRGAVVNLYYGVDQSPAATVNGPGGAPFPGTVASGESAVSTTIFTVPLAGRGDVRITLDLSASMPTTVFVGQAPK